MFNNIHTQTIEKNIHPNKHPTRIDKLIKHDQHNKKKTMNEIVENQLVGYPNMHKGSYVDFSELSLVSELVGYPIPCR